MSKYNQTVSQLKAMEQAKAMENLEKMGITLEQVQGVQQKVSSLISENKKLKAENSELKEKLANVGLYKVELEESNEGQQYQGRDFQIAEEYGLM